MTIIFIKGGSSNLGIPRYLYLEGTMVPNHSAVGHSHSHHKMIIRGGPRWSLLPRPLRPGRIWPPVPPGGRPFSDDASNGPGGKSDPPATNELLLPREEILKAAAEIPRELVRNFAIVAHIDAGKSTLSDKILVTCGNLSPRETKAGQVLDKLRVERERGITVKAQSATMRWRNKYLLNLVDTPGHVDFSFEVRRSLAAAQGALLLVDSTQGVQAQTMANYNLAQSAGLVIIPTLTKLDLKTSDPDTSLRQMESLLGIKEEDVIWSSAKTGEGVSEVVDAIVSRIPPPPLPLDTNDDNRDLFRGCVIDLWYDQYRGVVVLILVNRGRLSEGDRVVVIGEDGSPTEDGGFEVKEVGINVPDQVPLPQGLGPGRIGYVLSVNSRGAKNAFIGATIISERECRMLTSAARAVGSKPKVMGAAVPSRPKPTVFASCYPLDAEDFEELKKAMNRLALNDTSVVMKQESSNALGQGFRCGFLGALHMEVFIQRLEDEFGTRLISTAPSVSYTCEMKDGTILNAESPSQLPEPAKVNRILEPMVRCTLMTPMFYIGDIMKELDERRAIQEKVELLDAGSRAKLIYRIPWSEAVSDFQDAIKGLSSGFASFDLVEIPPEPADIVKIDMLLNGEKAEPLSFVCHRSQAEKRGREVAKRLKDVIPAQQFEVIIQAAVGAKIVARERMRGMRKNVLEKSGKTVGGGDVTRKRKLLEAQRAGKEKLKSVGSIQLNQEAFRAVLDRRGGGSGDSDD